MADSAYASIVVVPADWTPDIPVGLSEDAHKRYFQTLQSGARVLIYKAAPVDAIVAEAEVIDQFMIRVEDWPGASAEGGTMTAVGTRADYVLPLRILYIRPSFTYIGLPVVQDWIDEPDFPYVEWTPISQEAYQEFANWP